MPTGDFPNIPIWPGLTECGWMCPKCGGAHAPSVLTCPQAALTFTHTTTSGLTKERCECGCLKPAPTYPCGACGRVADPTSALEPVVECKGCRKTFTTHQEGIAHVMCCGPPEEPSPQQSFVTYDKYGGVSVDLAAYLQTSEGRAQLDSLGEIRYKNESYKP